CEVVLHLAGKVHAVAERPTDEDVYRRVNIEGTRNVLEGVLAGGGRRVIYFSSVKVFGEGTTGCVDESMPPHPEGPYGRSKRHAEQLVLDYGTKAGLMVTCLRLPLVYGPSHKGNLFRMIEAIDHGRFPPLPEVHNRRSMLHVDNLVQAVLLTVTSERPLRSCYIVTDEQPYSVSSIYEMLCAALGKPCPTWRVPLWALKAAAWAGSVLEDLVEKPVPFTRPTLDKLLGSAWYSAEAIARDLKYRPTRSFADAAPELIAAYRSGWT
ncbi:MAG: NAD-dependent epimerase/dehydratase family protein, partial [Nitrospiraceae bacterium]